MLVSSASACNMAPMSQKLGELGWRAAGKTAARDCEDILLAHDARHAAARVGSPQPGTTFPPGRCSMQQFDELVAKAAKCHSESDLVSAWVLRNRHFDDDDDDDLKADGARVSMNDDQDSKDSDLFFDFDIAPDEGMKAADGVTRDAATTEAAAAAAAASGEIPVATWDDHKQQPAAERSSPTAVKQAAKKSPESPLVSPDSLLEEPVPDLLLEDDHKSADATGNSNFKSDSSDDDDDDESPLTFVKGDYKHTVASSTLSSLVAMLEKESSRSKGRDGGPGRCGRGYRSELQTIAASPATTSFLTGGAATDPEDFQQQQRTVSPFGIRADSMPCLPKHREQIKKVEKTQQQEKQQQDENNVQQPEQRQHSERKAKMRRASSLKAPKSSGCHDGGRKLSVRCDFESKAATILCFSFLNVNGSFSF